MVCDMKKIYCIFCMLLPMIASADALDDKIARLTQEKLDKLAKLEQCQKSTKGLKIAGWTTLGISAIGIAANIGEAVALNKLDDKIDVAKQTVSNLDSQIQEQQRKNELKKRPVININDTCGAQTCGAAPTQSVLDSLNATEAVCVNGAWTAKICKENFAGTASTCTLNGQVVTYIGACNPVGAVVPVTVEEKNCPEITQEWLNQNNALSGECDKTTGLNYIVECKTGYNGVPRANGATGYEKCEVEQENQNDGTVIKRKHHSDCTLDEQNAEKAKGANLTWIYNNKCVPRSCKDSYFLVIKNGTSQGNCRSTCPEYQQVPWKEGGKACEITKTQEVIVAKECTANKEDFKRNHYASEVACDTNLGQWYVVSCESGYEPTNVPGNPVRIQCIKKSVVPECQEKKQGWTYYRMSGCNAFATVCGYQYQSSCSVEMGRCNEALCVQYMKNSMQNKGDGGIELRPDPSMVNNKGSGVLSACNANKVPGIANQMSCTSVCQTQGQAQNCKIISSVIKNGVCYCNYDAKDIPVGRDMGGATIYYRERVKGVVGNPEATVDGVLYKANSTTALVTQRERSGLDNLRSKLEAAGYSNFILVKAN